MELREKNPGAGRYAIAVKLEEQHSIWRADRELPTGWNLAGLVGSEKECLAQMQRIQPDTRPVTLIKKQVEAAVRHATAVLKLVLGEDFQHEAEAAFAVEASGEIKVEVLHEYPPVLAFRGDEVDGVAGDPVLLRGDDRLVPSGDQVERCFVLSSLEL